MRFRKRVSLGKGLHVNLSKSGVSLTGGVSGFSVSAGKQGTFLNTGIPGTGLYDRTRIGGGKARGSRSGGSSGGYTGRDLYDDFDQAAYLQEEYEEEFAFDPDATRGIQYIYNDDGTVSFIGADGNQVTDPGEIRRIRRSDAYKAELARLTDERMREYDEKMEGVIHIQRQTPRVYSTLECVERVKSMKPRPFMAKEFPIARPEMSEVIAELSAEAEREISVTKPQKRQVLCQRYVNDTKDIEYRKRCSEWQKERGLFLMEQEEARRKYEEEEQARCRRQQALLIKLIQGDQSVVDRAIDSWLERVRFDFDFHLEYEHAGNALFVDLDLPEIEDMPRTKVQRMANGTAKIKSKSKKEIKEDYARCVLGLAIYFAGNIFNKALRVQQILLSGYTQRRDKSGDVSDDYIYSIVFDRGTFGQLPLDNDDPEGNCLKFTSRIDQKADRSFRTITPYGPEDLTRGGN